MLFTLETLGLRVWRFYNSANYKNNWVFWANLIHTSDTLLKTRCNQHRKYCTPSLVGEQDDSVVSKRRTSWIFKLNTYLFLGLLKFRAFPIPFALFNLYFRSKAYFLTFSANQNMIFYWLHTLLTNTCLTSSVPYPSSSHDNDGYHQWCCTPSQQISRYKCLRPASSKKRPSRNTARELPQKHKHPTKKWSERKTN